MPHNIAMASKLGTPESASETKKLPNICMKTRLRFRPIAIYGRKPRVDWDYIKIDSAKPWHGKFNILSGKPTKNYGKSPFSMGKFTN